MSYRTLTSSEITALENQGCFSLDWSKIEVKDPFSLTHIHHVRFLGEVKVGILGRPITLASGEQKTSRLFNTKIVQCELGDDVLLDNVQMIRNYRLGDQVIMQNVDSATVSEASSFANGFEIEVLNEGGGRELKLFDQLSAQLAYILVSYRHDPDLIASINKMIDSYASQKTSDTGTIGSGTEILNTRTIESVNIGEHASIHGASLLKNGTIVSNKHAPASVGENVIAKNFIQLSGSRVDGGAMVDKSFVGQGVEIGKAVFCRELPLFCQF